MHEGHAGTIFRIASPDSLRGRANRRAARWQVKCEAKNVALDFGKNTLDCQATLAEIEQPYSVFVHVD